MNDHRAAYFPPIVTAALSGFIAWLASVNWIGVAGMLISAGWLVIAAIKIHWESQDRFHKKRVIGVPHVALSPEKANP